MHRTPEIHLLLFAVYICSILLENKTAKYLYIH